MKLVISQTPEQLGRKAAAHTARLLRRATEERGTARLMMSTGASQFTTIDALTREEVDWSRVEMFHLDEYIGLSQQHPASFIKYLRERFISKVHPGTVHFVDTSRGAEVIMETLGAELAKAPVDVGLIGIGENAHIAFNDPPADFETEAAYKVVTLDDACRRQQLGEGWFASLEEVPRQAVSATVRQILRCKSILCAVPYAVKAEAVYKTLTAPAPTPEVPASILATHPDVTLYLDGVSSAKLTPQVLQAARLEAVETGA